MTKVDPDHSRRRIRAGTAWSELCEMPREAGSVILGEDTPADPFDRAEGFRYLSRLHRFGLQADF